MRELEIDVEEIRSWFDHDEDGDPAITLVRASDRALADWPGTLVGAARRCYVSDTFLAQRARELDVDPATIVAAVIPDPGSVMAGDFGEIVALLFLAASDEPTEVIAPKKWRLKQDRLKPAPYSDVVQFVVPDWPEPSSNDRILCAEVKTKSTDSNTTPISSAISDSEKDRLGRLAKTLAWLKERALLEDLGSTSLDLIERFSQATEHPPAEKQFFAVAVICTSLLDAELADAPDTPPDDCSVVVIGVPDLKSTYEHLFEALGRPELGENGTTP